MLTERRTNDRMTDNEQRSQNSALQAKKLRQRSVDYRRKMAGKVVYADSLSGAVRVRLAEILERCDDHRQPETADENVEDTSNVA